MVLLDLRKAFDTVKHSILLDKLRVMGVCPNSLNWFKSYLTDRKQVVCLNNVQSNYCSINTGVPQGSILGPLLFTCYINDISISTKCKTILYADDTALLVSGKSPENIANCLSRNLDSCNTWLINNELSLHVDKTEAILFGPKKKYKKN